MARQLKDWSILTLFPCFFELRSTIRKIGKTASAFFSGSVNKTIHWLNYGQIMYFCRSLQKPTGKATYLTRQGQTGCSKTIAAKLSLRSPEWKPSTKDQTRWCCGQCLRFQRKKTWCGRCDGWRGLLWGERVILPICRDRCKKEQQPRLNYAEVAVLFQVVWGG